jgi:hypothetical protein
MIVAPKGFINSTINAILIKLNLILNHIGLAAVYAKYTA